MCCQLATVMTSVAEAQGGAVDAPRADLTTENAHIQVESGLAWVSCYSLQAVACYAAAWHAPRRRPAPSPRPGCSRCLPAAASVASPGTGYYPGNNPDTAQGSGCHRAGSRTLVRLALSEELACSSAFSRRSAMPVGLCVADFHDELRKRLKVLQPRGRRGGPILRGRE